MQLKIEGLESEVRRIVAEVLADREDDPWYDAEGAAAYLNTTVGQVPRTRPRGTAR